MKRIFLPELLSNFNNVNVGSLLTPDTKVLHRIKDVLRAEEGSLFEFIDGNGLVVQAEFLRKDCNFVVNKIDRIKKQDSNNICVAVSIIRRERFDLMVEKAVELGVDKIIPFRSERSKPYSNESFDKLKDRWQRIADQALSQCKRDFRCVIDPICNFNDLKLSVSEYHNKVGFDPTGIKLNKVDIDTAKNTIFIIGPEGGFSSTELSNIKSWGANLYSVSDNILRAETAVFYALSVFNFLKF